MVQLGERLGFRAATGRDLQGDQALHGQLAGEKNPGKLALAEKRQQVKVIEPIPG